MTTSDDFEAAARGAEAKVAEFDVDKKSVGARLQHLLHQIPSLVPLTVLIFSIIIFGLLIGQRFFSPFALTLILQQVQIVGIVGAAQALVILTAGIDLSVG
ncbi:MAG: ABC transporter permease, partial [Pseudomonadota bacterium]